MTKSYVAIVFLLLAFESFNLTLAFSGPRAPTRMQDRTYSDKKTWKYWRIPIVEGGEVGNVQTFTSFSYMPPMKMKTISMKPTVFEVPNFLSSDECDHLIMLARNHMGLEKSPVIKDKVEIDEETSERTFKLWDENEDGYINPEEVMVMPGKQDLYFTEDDVMQMFKELDMDTDGNGLIDFKEYNRTTVKAVKEYVDKLRDSVPRMWSRNSEQSWIWHDKEKYEVIADFHGRLSRMTKIPAAMISATEPMQVVRYDENGHYHCHHDSDEVDSELPCCTYSNDEHCRLCRLITVMVYLNEPQRGGETAFPVAGNETFSHEDWARKESNTKCNLARYCDKSNLIIKPEKGKAVWWYNHFVDEDAGWMGDLDQMTYHGGCEVTKSVKWIANVWINLIGKAGTGEAFEGWLAGSNPNEDMGNESMENEEKTTKEEL